jgi:hypothetical protein
LVRLARLGRVDQVTTGADHDVIAAEHGRDLVRRRRAAGEGVTATSARSPGGRRRQRFRR